MAKKKSNKFISVFKIFFSSIKTYFLYLDKCAKHLAFPVFGQLLSIFAIFALTWQFCTNADNLRALTPFLQNDNNLLISFYIVLIPFFLVFTKALFDYLIAFTSFNLLFFTVSGKSRVKNVDLKANDEIIKRRLPHYILLMLIVSILTIVPPFIFVSPIIWLFLCLCFQVFALEGDTSAFKAISRSVELVKGNVFSTIIMLLLCYFVTYQFLSILFIWAFEKISLDSFMINTFEKFFSLIPLDNINSILAPFNQSLNGLEIAKNAYVSVISFIIIAFTLPFRCCCFTELYKLYDADKIKEYSKESGEIISRAGRKRKN